MMVIFWGEGDIYPPGQLAHPSATEGLLLGYLSDLFPVAKTLDTQSVFLAKSEVKAHDLEHKRKLAFNIQKYADTVVKGKLQFTDLDLARRKAKNVKWK